MPDAWPVVSGAPVAYTAVTLRPRGWLGEIRMIEGKKTLTTGQWLVLAAAFLGWMFDGVEIGLFPLVGRAALQDLLQVTDEQQIMAWMSRITACFLVGAAIGGVSLGWLGDKIGRVRGMVVCMLTYSIFTGLCYFVTTPWQMGACIFLAALGMGGEWSLAVALVVECWPERHRPKLAGIIGAACNVGFLFVALVALTRQVTVMDWRWMMLVGASPALLALLIISFVPESERWKASVKQGGKSPIIAIFGPEVRRKTILAAVMSGIPLIGTWAAVSAYIPNWVDEMSQAQEAKTRLAGDSLATYQTIKNPKERRVLLEQSLTKEQWIEVRRTTGHSKAQVSIVIAVGAILGCLAASTIGGMYGRRPVYFGMCLLSFLSASYLFRFLTEFNTWFMVVVFFVAGVTAAFYGWLPLYLPELFPTRIRATGQGLSFNFGRILAAGGTLCLGWFFGLFDNDYGRAMGAVAMIYLLGMVVIWFAPETKGQPLPD
jgi:MFS transporter, SHS family, sialic acid transporter